jgi:hypothetical protein
MISYMLVELDMTIFETELGSLLQLDDRNTKNIHRLCNCSDLSIQFLCIQHIICNVVSL